MIKAPSLPPSITLSRSGISNAHAHRQPPPARTGVGGWGKKLGKAKQVRARLHPDKRVSTLTPPFFKGARKSLLSPLYWLRLMKEVGLKKNPIHFPK